MQFLADNDLLTLGSNDLQTQVRNVMVALISWLKHRGYERNKNSHVQCPYCRTPLYLFREERHATDLYVFNEMTTGCGHWIVVYDRAGKVKRSGIPAFGAVLQGHMDGNIEIICARSPASPACLPACCCRVPLSAD